MASDDGAADANTEAGAVNAVDGQAEAAEMLALRRRVTLLEAENETMRRIVLRVAEARMCRDTATMIESCPHCSLKRGGTFGYSGHHDERCIVTEARRLGF